MKIKNNATEQILEVTPEQWETFKKKKQPGNDKLTMAQMYTPVKGTEGDKVEPKNLPAEFKKVGGVKPIDEEEEN